MIDIGLTKIALIGVVALVVIGPEKLPKVARMVGTLFGRAQRYLNQVKSEVSREMELDELRKMRDEMQTAASEVEQSINQDLQAAQASMQSVWGEDEHAHHHSIDTPRLDLFSQKAKIFRKKKLTRTSSIPTWYKHQHGRKTRVVSAAARVAKYRPASSAKSSAFFP